MMQNNNNNNAGNNNNNNFYKICLSKILIYFYYLNYFLSELRIFTKFIYHCKKNNFEKSIFYIYIYHITTSMIINILKLGEKILKL